MITPQPTNASDHAIVSASAFADAFVSSNSSASAAARMMTIARPLDEGWVYSSQDYRAGELVTWAQVCLWLVGKSDLSKVLLAKGDPHALFACTMLGIEPATFDKKIKEHGALRQAAKPWNFSKPGGGGVPTIVLQARTGGEDTPHPDGPSMIDDGNGELIPGFKGLRFCTVMHNEYCGGRDGKSKRRTWGKSGRERPITPTCSMCLELGQQLEANWSASWSEGQPYFGYVTRCIDEGMVITPEMIQRWAHWAEVFSPYQKLEPMQIAQLWSGRIRKVGQSEDKAPFCQLANTFFQALLADAAKLAHRIAVRECWDSTVVVPSMLFHNSLPSKYAGGRSPLYGSVIPAFQHDELLGEHPRSIAHECCTRIAEIMRDCLRYVCPDLADAAEAEETLMECWQKSASKVVHNGRVVPWTREHNEKKCPECIAEKTRKAAA